MGFETTSSVKRCQRTCGTRGAIQWESGWFADMRNKKQQRGPGSWWAAEPPERRAFFRALANLVESLMDNQILEVRFSKDSFQPVLRTPENARPVEEEGSHNGPGGAERFGPDGWWAGLSVEGRNFYVGVSKILDEVIKGHSFLEVTREGGDLQACLVFRINVSGGRPELN